MKQLLFFCFMIFCLIAVNTADGCTIVMVAKGKIVLAGNNEDFKNPKTKIWFIPASDVEYGRVYVGDDGYVQGGMNDQGLFIDENFLSPTGWKADEGKPMLQGSFVELIEKILATCATVEDAIELFEKYNVSALASGKYPIADRTGASVVVEYGKGQVQYVRKNGVYQISTNFVFTNVKNENYPCTRYRIADKMLKNTENISLDLVRAILSATHNEGRYPTVYSNICDLKNGDIYIYNFHNFEEVVKFNLKEELKKGKKSYDLPSLFSIKSHVAYKFDTQRIIPASDVLFEAVKFKGAENAIERYYKMKTQFKKVYQYDFSEDEIETLGYRLLNVERTEDAIEIFKLNVSEHPESWNTYDSLGEAYMKHGDKELSIKNYKKSLELNPDNENGRKMLKQLKEKKSN